MNDQVRINGPVKVESSSEASVAFELMQYIASWEEVENKGREYWLTLYLQCRKASRGVPSLKEILNIDS